MRRFASVVASTQAHLGWGRPWVHLVITLLILHFTSSVKGWDSVPNLPNVTCQTPLECVEEGWTEPLPDCVESRCLCPSGTCPVYTTVITSYLYFCGSCGMLGSECSNSSDCMMDWQCENSFCECDQGTAYRGVCLYYYGSEQSFIGSLILLIVFVVTIKVIMLKIISRKCKTPTKSCCCCRSYENEDESRVVASNPQSDDKTAAFTISNTEFITTVEDPDLALALERSREYYVLEASTLSTTRSSFTGDRPPDQPGTSGWRQSPNGVGTQRRSSRTSLSSASSSGYSRSSSSSSVIVSSYSTALPSASPHSSVTSSPCIPSTVILSDEVSLPSLESLRKDFEDSEFDTTRV